jgi:hypothetical protein
VSTKKIRVNFVSSQELHEAAKEKAAAEDVSLSQVIRWLLWAWVRGDIPTRPPESEQEAEP